MSLRMISVLLLIMLAVCFASCSSLNNGTGTPTDPNAGQLPAELATAVDSALPSLDALPEGNSTVELSNRGVSAPPPDPTFSVIGRSNSATSANVVDVGDSISLPSGASEISWALYGWRIEYAEAGNITPYCAPYRINFNTDDVGDYYVALADFKRSRWEILPDLQTGVNSVIEIGLEPNAASSSGHVWFAIITFGGETVQVDSIDFYYPDGPASADDPVDYHQWIEAADGARLATNIYLPTNPPVLWAPPYPVVLVRTPYNKAGLDAAMFKAQTDLNICPVIQYFRGRHGDTGDWPDSDGIETMFKDHVGPDHTDALDTVDWLEARNFYNGTLSTAGPSAMGLWQYQAATELGDRLTAMYPQVSAGHAGTWGGLRNGCFKRSNMEGWITVNGFPPELYTEIRDNFENVSYWQDLDYDAAAGSTTCPGYHETGWWDVDVDATINSWQELQANGGTGAAGNQYLIIGPWSHETVRQTVVGELTFPSGGGLTDPSVLGSSWDGIGWIPFMLGRNPLFSYPTNHIKAYWIGEEGTTIEPNNHWYELDAWPPAYTEYVYYFDDPTEPMGLPILMPDSGSVVWNCDPTNPVPTAGGANLPFPPTVLAGPRSQLIPELHSDSMTFRSGTLITPQSLGGPVKVKLWVSTDAADTDIMVSLVDNYPAGPHLLVCDSAVRLSWYVGTDVVPDQVYEVNLELGNVGYVFDDGHEIIVNISSTNYPRFDINPGNGDAFLAADEANAVTQHNTLYFGTDNPSSLTVPLFDPSA